MSNIGQSLSPTKPETTPAETPKGNTTPPPTGSPAEPPTQAGAVAPSQSANTPPAETPKMMTRSEMRQNLPAIETGMNVAVSTGMGAASAMVPGGLAIKFRPPTTAKPATPPVQGPLPGLTKPVIEGQRAKAESGAMAQPAAPTPKPPTPTFTPSAINKAYGILPRGMNIPGLFDRH